MTTKVKGQLLFERKKNCPWWSCVRDDGPDDKHYFIAKEWDGLIEFCEVFLGDDDKLDFGLSFIARVLNRLDGMIYAQEGTPRRF